MVNENGGFEISTTGITDLRLVASFAGFITDTVATGGKTYLSITLKKDLKALEAVTARSVNTFITAAVGKVELINQRELSKAACCDLAGCFGAQASVQAHTTNVVTNAQELRILGLSGVYNQLLVDGLPMLQGTNYTYGVSTYPGTVVENIYVSKGTTSVLQGFESISGQINMETRQPGKTDKLHLNAYINSFGEKHFNANLSVSVGAAKKWHSLFALHTVQPAARFDRNNDGFLDLPLLQRYMVFNKWQYRSDTDTGFSAQIGLRFVQEKRIGGQTGYDADADRGSDAVYGQLVRFSQPEAYTKLMYRFHHDHAVVLAAAGSYHEQDSWLGITSYQAQQQHGYFNLQHEWLWQQKHLLKYGISYRYQQLDETISFSIAAPGLTYAGDYKTALRVPGFFAENTFHWAADKVVLITGARMDRHQDYGWYFTPRSLVKYNVSKDHTFRASAGTGWRQVNLFSEQAMILATSRNIEFKEPLKPEKAINWGVSHTYRFAGEFVTGTISADFYSTIFSNQFFPDYDIDPSKIIIRNFTGPSRSNGLQVESSVTLYKQLEVRGAYNYLDVYQKKNGEKLALPFNPRNRAMMAISYRTFNNKWQADINGHWFDQMRLPDTRLNPEPYRRPSYSTPYATLNAQGTFRINTLELYAGCENIFNYVQPNPIISADNPFGPYFDLSSVWGPTRGRELYLGIRYSLK